MAHVIYSGAFGVMKFIQQQAMECFSVNSGGANHVPPLRCRSPRRPVRGLGLGRSSGGALHEHDGHHFYSGPCAPLIYSPKTQIYFIHYAFPGADPVRGILRPPGAQSTRPGSYKRASVVLKLFWVC